MVLLIRLAPHRFAEVLVFPHAVPFGLGLVQLFFEFVLPLGDLAYDGGIDAIDLTAFIEHGAGHSLTRNQSFEFGNGQLAFEQVLDLLADVVPEFANAVSLGHIEVNGQLRDPLGVLVTKPGGLGHLLADFSDDFLIRLDIPLQVVERILQFSD